MIDQIKAIDNYKSMDPADIRVSFSELVLRPESFKTFRGVAKLLNNVVVAEQLVTAMRAFGLNASADSLCSDTGLDFGDPITQSMIDTLVAADDADAFTPELGSLLKSFGQQTRWESLGGIGDVPTVQQIQAAIDADNAAENEEADSTSHEVLLSANRSHDGTLRVVARITEVELKNGQVLRRGTPQTVMSDELKTAVSAIVEGLING